MQNWFQIIIDHWLKGVGAPNAILPIMISSDIFASFESNFLHVLELNGYFFGLRQLDVD